MENKTLRYTASFHTTATISSFPTVLKTPAERIQRNMANNVENSNYPYAKKPPNTAKNKNPERESHHYSPITNYQTDLFPPLPPPPSPDALSYYSPTQSMPQMNNGQRTPTPSPTPILTQVLLPPSGSRQPPKRQAEELEDPRTPTRQRSYSCSSPRQIAPLILGTSTSSPYGPDEDMEEDTDWSEEERHFNRLNKVRDLLNDLAVEFTAAQSEQCLNFLTEDPEIKEQLAKFSNLVTSPDPNTYNNLLFTGISDIQKLIEQVSGKLDKMSSSPLASPDKSINGSIHAMVNHPPPIATTSPPPKPLYTTTVKNTQPKAPQITKQDPKQPLNPKTSHHPSRLVVQFKPNGIPPEQRPDPSHISRQYQRFPRRRPPVKTPKSCGCQLQQSRQPNTINTVRPNGRTTNEVPKLVLPPTG